MSVYRIKKSWKAEVWINNRKTKTKSGFRTKYEAQRWKSEFIAKYHANPEDYGLKKNLKMDDLFDRYKQDHLPTLRSGTQRRYVLDLKERLEPWFNGVKLSKLTPGSMATFRGHLIRETELSNTSINRCCDLLQSILRKGEEWDMLSRSPYKLRRLKVEKKKHLWWEEKSDIRKFLEAIRGDRYEAAYRLGLECGFRLGEIVGLSKKDVSFDLGRIHIHRQWDDHGKCYGPTKSNQERVMQFSPHSDLARCLRKAIDDSPDPEMIFVTNTGKRVGCRNLAGDRFQNLIKRAGLPRITFHALRHTFASWYMIQFDDIWKLMQLLGHSNIEMTQKYAHLSSKHQSAPEFNWDGGEVKPLQNPSRGVLSMV